MYIPDRILIDSHLPFEQYATMMKERVIRPPALRPGDAIAIAAPASCFPREPFTRGTEWLEAQGFRVYFREDLFERMHYLAGPASRRLSEVHELFERETEQALFFARGGYGSMHLLPDLQLRALEARPRIVIGCSDLTPLLNLLPQRLGMVSFHGPMVAGLTRTRPESLEQLIRLLTRTDEVPGPIGGGDFVPLRGGRVVAPLCGGNLSLIAATLGTPFELDTRGRILCLEDVGERPYRIDRLLQQLFLAGKLQDAAGIAVGELVDCGEPGGRGRPLMEIFETFVSALRIPVVTGLPFGHGAANDTLPLGALAELDADRGTLQVLTPVVC